jgi:SP family arabinose:H+ symporter-like MFS transporter
LAYRSRPGCRNYFSTAFADWLATELSAGGQLRTVAAENIARMKMELTLPDFESLGQSLSCGAARTSGGPVPDQHRHRHSAGLLLKLSQLGLGPEEWRWQFGVAAAPALLFLLLLFGIPRSPRWLATKGKLSEAISALQMTGSRDPEAELNEIARSIDLERSRASEPLFIRKYRYPIFLAVTIGMFNQLSGINAILYYLNDIFYSAGFSEISGNFQAVAVGGMNLIATLFAMTLIDKLGRKTLLLIGSVGTAACLSGVAAIFFSNHHQDLLLWLLLGYIGFFAISQGAVIWVYISEVFPNRVRAKGQSLGSSSHWIMNALISGVFPMMATSSGAYPFVFFAFMMVLQFCVVLYLYPEPKQVTLEQLQHHLGIE